MMSKKKNIARGKEALERATAINFPAQDVIPKDLLQDMEALAKHKQMMMPMLLASLIPASAAVMGTKTEVKLFDFSDQTMCLNSYVLVSAAPASGKSNAGGMVIQDLFQHIKVGADGTQSILLEVRITSLINYISLSLSPAQRAI